MSILNIPEDQLFMGMLGMRMMSAPGNLAQGFAQAGMGAIGDVQQYAANKQRRQMTELQTQQVRAQMEEAARAQQSRTAMNTYLGGLDPDGAMPADMTGPRREPMRFDYRQAIAKGADYEPALQMQQLLTKAQPQPIKLGSGEQLLDPTTFRPLANNPKADDLPSAVREYQFAVSQGYKGTFEQFNQSQRKASAPNIGLPKIDIKVGEGVAGQVGPLVASTREQALSGVKLVDSANRILSAAERGNLFAGPGANLLMKGAQVADVLGLGGKDTKEKISNTRTVVRAMAEQGVAARSQLGGQAQISNAEQELLTRATSGDIADLTAGEIIQIAQLNDRLGRQLYERHQQSLGALANTPNTQNLMPFFQVPPLPEAFKPKARSPQQVMQDADAILNGGR